MPEYALEEITDLPTIIDYSASRGFYMSGQTQGSWTESTYNQSLTVTSSSKNNSTVAVQNALIQDLAAGDDLILTSNTNAYVGATVTVNGRQRREEIQTLVADHAMSIYGYDVNTGEFEIRNPWGTSNGVTPTGATQVQQDYETTFEVSLSTLLADGDTITADSIGAKTAPAAPTALQTANQTWTIGQSVDLSLAGAFTDPQQNDTLAYQATLSNGSALPSWLTFNSSNQTFTGAVAQTKCTGLSVTVTATDTSTGLSAADTFTVTISKATSGLVQAISGLPNSKSSAASFIPIGSVQSASNTLAGAKA